MAGSGPIQLAILLGAVALIAPYLQQAGKPEMKAIIAEQHSASDSSAAGASGRISLDRASDGHFYADARVNGISVRFLIDTGASAIVLAPDDARRVSLGTGEADVRARGAGGEIKLRPVTLARLSIAGGAHDNVPAFVAEEGALPVSLLGQSFLSRFGSVTIAGDRMELH